ncbi:RepA leader peptide Tap, partial [Salmonella enterica]|nr:RepA leader peptide Tap [Salmonella enterica]
MLRKLQYPFLCHL